jgi:PAS domain S-box-containing protein
MINQQLHDEISYRQQAEAKLRESEERLQLALEASAEGWWDWDMVTGVVKRSPQYLQLLGYEAGEFPDVVDSWENSIHADDFPRLMERLTAHLQDSSVPYACEYRIRAKSGEWQWISDYGKVVVRDAANQPLRMIGTFRDITDRKRTEIALAASQQRYQNLVETSPDIIERFDLQLRHLYVSSALTRITGIAPEAFLGKTCRELGMDESMVNTWEAAAAQLLSTGQKQVIEFAVPTLQGVRSFEMVIAPDISDQGTIESILCISRDITERKQSAQALQESEARFQAFMNHSPAAAWITDAKGIMLYASRTYCRTFQLPTSDLVGQSIFDLYPTDVANQFLNHIQRVAQTQQVLEAIEIAPRPDGTMGDFLVYKFPIPDASGHPLIGGVAIDVTQQHQAEAALRHQKEMFQAIVDHIPVMIALFNQQGQIEFINPELERCLGWSLADCQQRDVIADGYPDPTYRQRVLDHMLAATGYWKDFTTINTHGQSLETTWANVRLSGGRFLGIGQDISDRKRKEIALRQAMEAAESANVAKSMFLANMSHELRTPLNVILGFTQVMAHDASLTLSQKEDLQTIRRSGDHLLSLINDVLDLSKIEAGHCTLEETGFDLISLLDGLRTMMAERANSKRLQLIFDIAPNVAQFVIADEQKLRQILLNLLSNAIKFTKQGSVTLQVTSQETPAQHDISLNSPQPIGYLKHLALNPIHILQFAVTDTGVGIATTEQDTIFDAFVQADAGKKSISGTGLGLTISRKLLELMHGTISVHSVPDVGSTFTVIVPVRPISGIDTPSEPPDRTVIGLAPGQLHRRVLVVDDQRENRLLMVRLLSQLGLQVREAANGQEAVQIWQEWRPDLTWMDIRMPILDGYEATKQIRSIDQEQASIIIALTAQASQSDRTLALAAGCNDYISKPFREETVFLKMAEYLGLEYLYASPLDRLPPPSTPSSALQPDLSTLLEPSLLAQLTPDWLNALEEAAICGSDQAIVNLTTQLAPEFAPLCNYLVDLANQFEFEQIIRWVDHNSQRGDHGGSA